ncbi:soluble guanylate cyclase gcy-35-like isoform X1 [Saccostrea cucullata]|uniref:soluble guanylate cyclase gcy-35-like isoform X1 n=2 Tax=Saccostrea cuccullata TaxID=36930 RepID=UPI002ED3DB72
MHGHVHLCLREMVIEQYGREAWDAILTEASLDDDNDFMLFHYYDDKRTISLVVAISNITGLDVSGVLESYGHYFYFYATSRGYDRMLRTLGKDFHTFVQNLDLLHSLLALTYKGMRPPHFRCEKKDGKLLVHVFTVRPGMYPAAIGMLTEVARQIFDTRINMSVVTRKTGEIFKQKYCEHVITEVKVLEEQKMAAITGEDQLMTNHVQSKLQQLAHARENYVVAVPELSLNTALPFSVVFDKNMFIQSAGLHLKTLCPEIQQEQSKINNIFDIKEPEVKFEYNAIMSCNSSYMYFFLQPKVKNRNGTPPKSDCPILRGHMVPLEDKEEIMFIGSPHFDSLGDLISSSSYLKNIPQDNMTMEIMFMNEQRRADVEMSKKLDETTAAMKKLAAALDQEKKKTDTLLYQMLPVKVANQLRDGGNVQAEKHENVTILFSDIVTFTNMAALCHPMDIVELLNDLFQRFDELTTKHDIYKVETIGDAYMVVSGVPEATDDHAIRIANMGLDMIQQTSHVINPVTNKSIQIRVGIHTGPVVSGVVGTKMPRYCLFGDTVNTASRMESHGLPGRVHISNTTHSEIREVGYILERRGGLDVKGKGIMDTYFINGVSDNFDASRKSQTQQEEHREHERIQIKRISPTPEKRPSPTSGSNSSFCSVM